MSAAEAFGGRILTTSTPHQPAMWFEDLRRASAMLDAAAAVNGTNFVAFIHPVAARQMGAIESGWLRARWPRPKTMRRRRRVMAWYGHDRRLPCRWQGIDLKDTA